MATNNFSFVVGSSFIGKPHQSDDR